MRKVTGILISLGLLFALAGCGGTAPANETSSDLTASVTQQAADILDADLYEIVPEEPYTEEIEGWLQNQGLYR